MTDLPTLGFFSFFPFWFIFPYCFTTRLFKVTTQSCLEKKEGKILVLDIEMKKIAFGNYWKTVKGIEKEIPGGTNTREAFVFLMLHHRHTMVTGWLLHRINSVNSLDGAKSVARSILKFSIDTGFFYWFLVSLLPLFYTWSCHYTPL